MATKTLIRLLIALALLGGIAAVLHFTRGGGAVSTVESSTTKKKVYDAFPINEVAKIVVKDKEASVTLTKGAEAWEIAEREGFPANAEPVVGLLRKIWDLNIVQPITIGRTQYGRLNLLDPAGADTKAEEAATQLVFQDKDGKDLASLWLGKVYARSEGRPDPFGGGGMATTDAGRYVKRGDSNSVYLVGETFSDVKTEASEWLDQNFFKVEGVKSIEFMSGTPADDWKLERPDDASDFTLANAKAGETIDKAKTASIKAAFSSPQFDDVFIGEAAKEQKTGRNTFKIVTFDGFRYEVSVGEKNDLNELPLTLKVEADLPKERKKGEEESEEEAKKLDAEFKTKLEGWQKKLAHEKSLEGRVFKVRSFVIDAIAKKRGELMEEKKEPEAGGAAEVAPGVSLPGLPPAPPVPVPVPAPAPARPAASAPVEAPTAPAPETAPKTVAPAPAAEPKPAEEAAPAPQN